MNWDEIKGNWKQAKGRVRQKWGELSDDELEQIAGQRDELVGLIQKKYGITREEADKQVSDWEASQ